MSDEDAFEYKDMGLKNLIKALKGTNLRARVGVLGKNASRKNEGSEQGLTNAEVGAAHEYGTDKLPVRSFLRMPITEQMQKALEKANFTADTINEAVRTGTLADLLAKIGIIGQGISLEAFDTGGFGKWKPSNMGHKKVKQTLVETHQLRDSITSDVVGGES